MKVKGAKRIRVARRPGRRQEGLVLLRSGTRRAALGKGGVSALKREGDGATPLGSYAIRRVLYRADRGPRPRTMLPVHAIGDQDGWSDDPADRNYNRMVRLPAGCSAESLRRDDHLYDLVLVLGHNDRPRVRGKGSAIFVHLARPGYLPTEGCLALNLPDLKALLAETGPRTKIEFVP